MGCCQNYGPFLGTLKGLRFRDPKKGLGFRIIRGIPKGTIILTNTHVQLERTGVWGGLWTWGYGHQAQKRHKLGDEWVIMEKHC